MIFNDELSTQTECEYEAAAYLAKFKDPLIYVPHVVVNGAEFISGSYWLAEPNNIVTLDLLGVSVDYGMENIIVNCAPKQNLQYGYDFTVEFDGRYTSLNVDADKFATATSGKILPVIKKIARKVL